MIPAMPTGTSLASRLRSLLAGQKELESLRRENASLLVEIKALRSDAADIARLLGGSARPRGSGTKHRRGRPSKVGKVGKRLRTTAAEVQKMWEAIAKAAPSDWKTKAEIVKAAGLTLDSSKAAWKWATDGVTLEGKKHAPVLKPNGERGMAGRYRSS